MSKRPGDRPIDVTHVGTLPIKGSANGPAPVVPSGVGRPTTPPPPPEKKSKSSER